MSKFINDYLELFYDEIEPMDFYRRIFPDGELEEKGCQVDGKYNAIAVELLDNPDSKMNAKRHLIHNGLEKLTELLKSDNFIILSPISYCGRSREAKNARYIYAIAIDLDGIATENHLKSLFEQFKYNSLPTPTYIVSSGNGLHLYYQLIKPIPCYKHITKQLAALKKQLTYFIWNKYVTEEHKNIQYQSLFQGFRLAGGVAKDGTRTRIFKTGEIVDIEYLNNFVRADEYKVTNFSYKSNLTLAEAKEKYPDWYDKRIIQKQPISGWQNKRALFDWWIREIKEKAKNGHRYFCIMCLAVYAKKCGIAYEELEEIAYNLVEELDKLTEAPDNHFTRADVLSALEAYNDNYIRFPIDTISRITDIKIEKNRRNGRKQATHLEIARFTKKILKDAGELKREGRKSKEYEVKLWHASHSTATKADCIRELKIDRKTVSKYWELSQ
jgi:hypothetical protein